MRPTGCEAERTTQPIAKANAVKVAWLILSIRRQTGHDDLTMKHIIALIVTSLLCLVARAAPAKVTSIEPELGAALGFQIYRFEAELGSDEVLIVRELTEEHGKVSASEFATVGSHVRAQYEIVLVDSGAFHPSLKNTYMFRFPTYNGYIENKRLKEWGTTEDTVHFIFSEVDSNEQSRKLTWVGSVEKYSEVVKRWPDLPKPRGNGTSGSRHSITKS